MQTRLYSRRVIIHSATRYVKDGSLMISAESQVLKDIGDKEEACLVVKGNLKSDLSSNFADISSDES